MTGASKLYSQLLNGKNLSFRDFQTLLEAFGFRLDRIVGSHHIYSCRRFDEQLNVQPDGQDAKRYQVRQFRAIIDVNGLTLED